MEAPKRFIYGVTSPLDKNKENEKLGINSGTYPHKNTYSKCMEQFKVKRRRKRTSKTKATRRLNPYLLFGNDRRDDIYAGNPTKSQAEIMKIIAEEWRQLPEHIKDHYKKKSIEEKQMLEVGLHGPKRDRRVLDDERRRPKKVKSPYMCFVQCYRPEVIKMNQDIEFNDVMKMVANKWNSMNSEEKKYYEELSRLDQKRYADEDKKYNGEVTTYKVKNDPEKKLFLTQYNLPIFEYFASKMNDTLKQDNQEANQDQIQSAIENAWKKMTDDQKLEYFQENEQEIKDYISILDDQINFCTEDQYDESIAPFSDITNISPPFNLCYIKKEISPVKVECNEIQNEIGTNDYLQNIDQNIKDKVKIASNDCGIDDAYKVLIEDKIAELEKCFKSTPLISPEANEKIKSLRDKINSSILCELDTCLLLDSIEKLSKINKHLTSVWEKVTGCKLTEIKSEIEENIKPKINNQSNNNSLKKCSGSESSKITISDLLNISLEKEGEEKLILIDQKLLKSINPNREGQVLSPINFNQNELLLKFECEDVFRDCYL